MVSKVKVFLLTAAVGYSGILRAQHDHHGAVAPEARRVSGVSIPDVTLVDQNGNRVRFYTDLIKGRLVAINTIFTTCTTICPVMGANFGKLGQMLPAEARGKARLISISIDPLVDTPERLNEWSAARGRGGSDWTLVTGPKADIDAVLKALQVFTADKNSHQADVLIGGDGVTTWVHESALKPPGEILKLMQSYLEPSRR
jgi:protein SCO1/2